MVNIRPIKGKRFLLLVFLFYLGLLPVQSAYSQFTCIPTCDVTDAKFMALSGIGLFTINNTDAAFQITSLASSNNVEIGIFDGDGTTLWDNDNPPFVILDFALFADPNGDGSGTLEIARWSSDGTFGDNIGDPMPDNDWFIRTLANVPQAQTPDGTYSYRMIIKNINPLAEAINVFKIRTDGAVTIPAGEAFNYMSSFRSEADLAIIYPNLDLADPACFDVARPGQFCNPNTDPNCCLIPSNYDGSWHFSFDVPPGLTTLDIWDGDFDYGSASRNIEDNCLFADGLNLDTDDPNTPIPLPPWSVGTDVVLQGASTPTNPPDDFGCFPVVLYPPSINYELIDPNGESYINVNPSGNVEWELFNISTLPFNPALYDLHVDNIEPGLWTLHTFGVDIANLNSYRLPFAVCGMDDENDPVCAPEEMPPAEVPTLNEWGLIVLSILVMLVAVCYIGLRKRAFS